MSLSPVVATKTVAVASNREVTRSHAHNNRENWNNITTSECLVISCTIRNTRATAFMTDKEPTPCRTRCAKVTAQKPKTMYQFVKDKALHRGLCRMPIKSPRHGPTPGASPVAIPSCGC